MCHFAVKIEEKYAIYNILFIGYIIYVIFVMSDFLTAYACVCIIVYLGYTYTYTLAFYSSVLAAPDL